MLRYILGFSFIIAILSPVAIAQTVVTAPSATQTTTTTTDANGTVVEKTIITPVPAAKEVIATPSGYASCFTVSAGWVNNVWVPAHQVCQYENMSQGVVWVEGYWKCTAFKSDSGECTSWDWQSGHWQKTFSVY